jgi:hypothetical protein
MSRKHRILLGLLAVLLIMALVLFGWFARRHSSDAEHGTAAESAPVPSVEVSASPSATTVISSTPVRVAALELCERHAPVVVSAYVTDADDRPGLLERYFTPDAAGLKVPVSELRDQPGETFSGGMNTGDTQSAVCSVYTGLDSSPWIVKFTYTEARGWLALSISGPQTGAYVDGQQQ